MRKDEYSVVLQKNQVWSDTDSVCDNMRITTSVEFFCKGSNPSRAFDVRESRSAYYVYDDLMKNEDIFIWTIGTEGRLNVTLEAPQLSTIPLRVKKVVMRVGHRDSYEMRFVRVLNGGEEVSDRLQVCAALSVLHPCLLVPSPLLGSAEKRYHRLHLFIVIEFMTEPKRTETFIKTIYCHVRKGSGLWTHWISKVLRPIIQLWSMVTLLDFVFSADGGSAITNDECYRKAKGATLPAFVLSFPFTNNSMSLLSLTHFYLDASDNITKKARSIPSCSSAAISAALPERVEHNRRCHLSKSSC